jgi:hypothetical protein
MAEWEQALNMVELEKASAVTTELAGTTQWLLSYAHPVRQDIILYVG